MNITCTMRERFADFPLSKSYFGHNTITAPREHHRWLQKKVLLVCQSPNRQPVVHNSVWTRAYHRNYKLLAHCWVPRCQLSSHPLRSDNRKASISITLALSFVSRSISISRHPILPRCLSSLQVVPTLNTHPQAIYSGEWPHLPQPLPKCPTRLRLPLSLNIYPYLLINGR